MQHRTKEFGRAVQPAVSEHIRLSIQHAKAAQEHPAPKHGQQDEEHRPFYIALIKE